MSSRELTRLAPALTLCGLCVLVMALALLPGAPLAPPGTVPVLAVLTLLAFGAATLSFARAGGRDERITGAPWAVPRPLAWAAGGLLLWSVLCVAVGPLPVLYSIQEVGDGYSYAPWNSDGARVVLTEPEYWAQRKAQTRLAAAFVALFAMTAAAMAAGVARVSSPGRS
ncbi:hypothetical protein [Streptomyces mayteni]